MVQAKIQEQAEKKKAAKQKLISSLTSSLGGLFGGSGGAGGLLGGLLGGNGASVESNSNSGGLVDGGIVETSGGVASSGSGNINGAQTLSGSSAGSGSIVVDSGSYSQGGSGSISSGDIIVDTAPQSFDTGSSFENSVSNSVGLSSPTETFRGPSSYDAGYQYPEPSQTFISPPETQVLEYIPPTPHVEYGPAINYPQRPAPVPVELVAPVQVIESHRGNGCSELSPPHQDVQPFDVRRNFGSTGLSNAGASIISSQNQGSFQTSGGSIVPSQNRATFVNENTGQSSFTGTRISTSSTGSVVPSNTGVRSGGVSTLSGTSNVVATDVIGSGASSIGGEVLGETGAISNGIGHGHGLGGGLR